MGAVGALVVSVAVTQFGENEFTAEIPAVLQRWNDLKDQSAHS